MSFEATAIDFNETRDGNIRVYAQAHAITLMDESRWIRWWVTAEKRHPDPEFDGGILAKASTNGVHPYAGEITDVTEENLATLRDELLPDIEAELDRCITIVQELAP